MKLVPLLLWLVIVPQLSQTSTSLVEFNELIAPENALLPGLPKKPPYKPVLVKVTLAIDNPLEATKAFLPTANGLFVVDEATGEPLEFVITCAAEPGTMPIALVTAAYTCCGVCVITMDGFTRER